MLFKVPCSARPIAKPTTPAPASTEVSTLLRSRIPSAIKKPIRITIALLTLTVICLMESCFTLFPRSLLSNCPVYFARNTKITKTRIANKKFGKFNINESSQLINFALIPSRDSLRLNSSSNTYILAGFMRICCFHFPGIQHPTSFFKFSNVGANKVNSTFISSFICGFYYRTHLFQ